MVPPRCHLKTVMVLFFLTVSCKGRQDTIAHFCNIGLHLSNLRPTNMIEAMVTDTGAHLGTIQGKRDQLEAMIAERSVCARRTW